MEIVEIGTWKDLVIAYLIIKSAPFSPSGKPNVYRGISYTFSVFLPLILKSPLSNALIGRTRWNISTIIIERNLILSDPADEYAFWLVTWRKDAFVAYLAHFKETVEAEKKVFGF